MCCEPWAAGQAIELIPPTTIADIDGLPGGHRQLPAGLGARQEQDYGQPDGWPQARLPVGCRFCAAEAKVDLKYVSRSFLVPAEGVGMTAKVKLFGHHAVIENAAGHVSVVLPKGHAGCGSGAAASSSSHAGGHGGGGKESGRFDSTGLHGVAEEDEAEGDGGHGAREEDGEGSVEDEVASAAGSGSQPSNLAPVADIANSASFIQRYRTKLTVDGRLREVEIESRVHGCKLAINGGLFDTKTGSCHGSTVTGGRVASVSGLRNAHFGIVSSVPNDVSMRMAFEHRPDLHHPSPSPSASGSNSRSSDGSAAAANEANEEEQYYPMRHGFMTGYLSESEVESLIDASAEQAEASWLNWESSGEAAEDPEVARRNARRRSKDNVVIGADSLPPVTVTTTTVTGDDTGSQPMKRSATSTAINELVSGAVWLVRNGQPIAMSSATDIDDSRVQETSHSMSEFAKTQSARTAVGHDGHGRMIVSQLDGRSWWTGIDLDTFSQWLAAQGVASAINVDGGGSATMVSKGEVINSPTYACADSDTQPQGSIPSGKTGLRGRAAAGALDTQHAEAQQYNTDAKPGKNFHCVRPVSSIICVHDAPAMPRVVRRPAPPAGDGPERHVLQLELSNGCVCTDSVVAADGAADALSVTQLASIVTTAGEEEEEEESDDSRRQLRQGRRLSQPVMSPRCMCTGVDAGGDPSVREHFIVRLVPTAKSTPGGSGGSDSTTRPSPSAVKVANDADDDGGDAEAPTSRASTAPARSQRPRPAATDSIPTMSATPKPSKAVPPTAVSVAAKASPTRAAKATAEAQASAAGAVSGLGDDGVDAETETSPMPVRGASSTAAGNVKRSPSAATSAAGNAKASTAPLVPSTVPRAPSRTASPSTAAGAKAAGGSDSAKARGTTPPLAASPKANAAAASSPAKKASSTSSKAPKRPDDNGEGHGSDDAFDADNAFESADIAEALRHQLGAPVSSASASPLVKKTKTAVLR